MPVRGRKVLCPSRIHETSDHTGALYITEKVTFLAVGAALMSFIAFSFPIFPGGCWGVDQGLRIHLSGGNRFSISRARDMDHLPSVFAVCRRI